MDMSNSERNTESKNSDPENYSEATSRDGSSVEDIHYQVPLKRRESVHTVIYFDNKE